MHNHLMNHKTLATKVGRNSALYLGVVNTPIFRASTILFRNLKQLQYSEEHLFDTMHYGRLGNPTNWALEDAIAELEGGYKGVSASSGLAIIMTVLMAYAKAGSHILIPQHVYGGVRRFCSEVLNHLDICVEFYSADIGAEIEQKVRQNTALIYVESPNSTYFEMTDLPAIIQVAKKTNIPVIVDNTWATPYYYQPIKHGADVSIHSATKYIIGHSDALLGIAVCTEKSWPIIKHMSFLLGTYASPDDAYLALRGLRTLPVRMDCHQKTALHIAKWLQNRVEIDQVYYPALKDDPGHYLWQRDFTGASGRFAIKLKTTSKKALAEMLDHMQHFAIGFSWGGYESILAPVFLKQAGVKQKEDIILLISIGLESESDLIDDLEKGLSRLNFLSKKR